VNAEREWTFEAEVAVGDQVLGSDGRWELVVVGGSHVITTERAGGARGQRARSGSGRWQRRRPCQGCASHRLPGVIYGNRNVLWVSSVMRCDECQRYGGDLDAAVALRDHLGTGRVMYLVAGDHDDDDERPSREWNPGPDDEYPEDMASSDEAGQQPVWIDLLTPRGADPVEAARTAHRGEGEGRSDA
jgi:hypothetical protein